MLQDLCSSHRAALALRVSGRQGVQQSVSLRIEGRAPARARAASKDRVTVAISERAGTMPRIGIEIPAKDAAASRESLSLVQALGPRLIVGEVLRHLGHGRREITAYREIADACEAGSAIEASLPCRDDPKREAAELAEACAASGARVRSLTLWAAADLKGVLPGSAWLTQPPLLEAIRWAALMAFPHSRASAGAHMLSSPSSTGADRWCISSITSASRPRPSSMPPMTVR